MVSEKIKELRKSKDWSQADLADRMGCSQVAICKIERSKRPPKLDRLLQIAQALEVSIAVFLPHPN
jgi:putative transcriptional regulator